MLTIEKDKIKLDDEYLPGVVQSISIGGSIVYEKQNTEGKYQRKVMLGYEDKTISISLKLFPQTLTGEKIDVYDQLAKLEKLFKKSENSVPQVYIFVHPQAKARNISKVLFQRLESSESVEKNIIDVSLEFIEFMPAEIITKEEEQKKPSTTNKTTNQTTTQTQKMMVEEQEPKIEWKKNLKSGYEAGKK